MKYPPIQDKLASEASKELTKLLKVPVKVGSVDLDWLSRLVLNDVSLDDTDGNVLFKADHISAGFQFLPLLEKKFVFTTVRLFGFSLHLKKQTPQSPLNIQFLIDAFAPKDSVSKTNIDLKINSVLLRRGTVNYDVVNQPSILNKLDPNHIHIEGIDGKISLNVFENEHFEAQIHQLSLKERSGFSLNKLSADVIRNPEMIAVQNLQIQLPQSHLEISLAAIHIDKQDSLIRPFIESPFEFYMAPSSICLQDFTPFVPVFNNYPQKLQVFGNASGTLNDVNLEELSIKQNGDLTVLGKMNLKNFTDSEKAYLFGKIQTHLSPNGLTAILNEIKTSDDKQLDLLHKLGNLNFTGEISGFIDQLVAYGSLESDVGSLNVDLLIGQQKAKGLAFYAQGEIASSNLHINKLFKEGNPCGSAQFNIQLEAKRPIQGDFSGTIKAHVNHFDYKAYRYENLFLTGSFASNEFNGLIELNDANGKLYAEGLFRNDGKNSAFNFSAKLSGFKPDLLYLTKKYENPELGLSVHANFTGNSADFFDGEISIDSLSFLTKTDSFYLHKFLLEANANGEDQKTTITSDIINGDISGKYSFRSLVYSFLRTSNLYLPSLVSDTQKKQKEVEQSLVFNMSVENTEKLSRAFKFPVALEKKASFSGEYNSLTHQFSLEALLPQIQVGKSILDSSRLICHNREEAIQLEVSTNLRHKNGSYNFLDIHANIKDDKIASLISLRNNQDKGLSIDFSTSTIFSRNYFNKNKSTLQTKVYIHPGTIMIKDSIWQLEPSTISFHDGEIRFDHFSLSKGNQHLHIDGSSSSKDPRQSILLDLNDIELSYIFDIINNPGLQFGGRATGILRLSDLYGSRIINTDLEVQNFSFNQVVQGKLNLFSEWDNTQQGILLLGTIYKNDSTWTDLNGYIYPIGEKMGLSLYFDANDVDLAMLHPYVNAFTNTIEGRGFGNLHLYGPFTSITFEGKAFITEGRIGVDFLNTVYSFSDTVYMHKSKIEGKNITIFDKDNNRGTISFEVKHNYLKDVTFHSKVQTDKLLLYDVPSTTNPTIYGTVYGSGNAEINASGQLVFIDANLRNEQKTNVGFNFMNGSSTENYDFIVFREQLNKKASDQTLFNPNPSATNDWGKTEIRINCLFEATPEAHFEFIVDPVSGDKIKGNGSGNLKVEYSTKSDFMMYGAYKILHGNYNFSLQQVIHRDFTIREGSQIDFRGNPYDANLNLKAAYYLTANIEDLDAGLTIETVRRSVPVNCILSLNGNLKNPAISFDMEFPNSTEELERQVKSFISTDEMMMRQIIYLLVLSKFYTPDYSKNDFRSSEFSSVASSALSAQLSTILNSLSDKVQIGTNIRSRQDLITDTEVEMLLSSQLLNNRLIFNGNFGYKNNIQTNAFIGEFDLEYKLNTSGEFRLKTYNHANDMYRYNKSLYRQGVGVMFYKDFNTLGEIFRKRKKNIYQEVKQTPVSGK